MGIPKTRAQNKPEMPAAQTKQVIDITEAKPTQVLASNTTSTEPTKIIKYTVKSGDTISKIALISGVPASNILKANNLSAKSILHIGQTLTIPGANNKASTKPAVTKPTTSKTTVKKTTSKTNSTTVIWKADALAQLRKIPYFVRPSVKAKITSYAKSHGIKIITAAVYKSIHI